MSEKQDTYEFKAEVQRVLSLVINSLYTNREVFLRELISNASDALDKARLLQLTEGDSVIEQEGEPGIAISLDKEKRVLVIQDNGVGMTRDEVVENLGTIAKSGTAELMQRLSEAKDKAAANDLIGQFGVGFYAVFMVAQRVDVETRSMKKGAEPVLWRSSGEGNFTVLPGELETHGTRITIHLKEEADEFAQAWRVESIITKYSDFVMFPIRVDDKVVNKSSALWRETKSNVSDEQHAEFFKHITQGRHGDKPLATVHYTVDAPVQFSALLYVPEKVPPETFVMQQDRVGLRLYAKRVLIMENCDTLLPTYLRFVRGVVDSEDLTLNVSRETLQENRTLRQIQTQLTKQILKELGRIADDDATAYTAVWKEYGPVLKEGLSVDFKNKDQLVELCRFESLKKGTEDAPISLKQYLADKPEEQQAIYYITGTSREQVAASPHLEVFRKKGFDVLFLTDPIDEWVVKSITEYEGVSLESVVHGNVDLDDDGDKRDEETNKALQAAVEVVTKALGDKVSEVRLSGRLTETASCLVSKEGDPGANMERIMRMLDERAQERKRILELNPDHPFVRNVAKLSLADPQAARLQTWSELLYAQALLAEGIVEDPTTLVKQIQDLLVESSNAAVSGSG